MHRKTSLMLRLHTLIVLVFVAISMPSCAKVEPPGSSCKYLIKLLGNEGKRRDIENWLEYIFDNPDEWQEASGKRFRGMGSLHISVPDVSHLKEIGLPEHTQLLVSKDANGNVTRVVAAVAQWVGIVFSKDNRFIVAATISDRQGERMGIMCLDRD